MHILPYAVCYETSRIFTKPQVWLYLEKKIWLEDYNCYLVSLLVLCKHREKYTLYFLDSFKTMKKGEGKCYDKAVPPQNHIHGWFSMAGQPFGVGLGPGTEFLTGGDRSCGSSLLEG